MSGQAMVLGAGAWGTALANQLARTGWRVDLYARDADHVAEMQGSRENSRRLPGVTLEAPVAPTHDLARLRQARLVLAVVPAQALRALANAAAGFAKPDVAWVICAKGIERETGLFTSDVLSAILPRTPAAILSGPSFAADLAAGLPTAVTLACADALHAEMLCSEISGANLRLYHSTDVRGVEIGGAAKNVLAIACGIANGRGLGASAVAALVARGFAEMARFGRAHGAKTETLMGLSGLGDLVLSCSSAQSRNFALGLALGRGESASAALAEGAFTATILCAMARRASIDMPISDAVDAVLAGRMDVAHAIETLLMRPLKGEG